MEFIIGSLSYRKVKIAEKVIKQFFVDREFSIQSFGAKSKMPDTPWDKQTFNGARNRALDSKSNIPNGDFYIGLESGLIERYGHIYEEVYWTPFVRHQPCSLNCILRRFFWQILAATFSVLSGYGCGCSGRWSDIFRRLAHRVS